MHTCPLGWLTDNNPNFYNRVLRHTYMRINLEMQLPLVRKLVGMHVDPILDKIFGKETGAARLQQIGLFTLIFMMDDGKTGVSAQQLADRSGQKVSAIYKQAAKLERAGVIEKRKTLNKLGRGRAFFFSIKQNAKAERVVNAIVKSITDRAGSGRKRK
jgi:predicted transcriptional regulator